MGIFAPFSFLEQKTEAIVVPQNPVTTGRVLELNTTSPSYPGSGNVWYDVSGNGYNFALTGSATFTTASGWDLNGSTDYFWLDSTSGFNEEFTGAANNGITVFVEHEKDNTTGDGVLLASWQGTPNVLKFLLEINNDRTVESAVSLSTGIKGGDSTGTVATQTREVTGFRVESGTNTRFNNDSDLAGTVAASGDWTTADPPTTIGGRDIGGTLTNPYDGKIKSVIVYNRALSSTERTQVYNYLINDIPGWTPADLNNIQNWWTAEAGLTESGGSVSSWEDQINGYQLIQTASAAQPIITSSASILNDQQVVYFDGTDDYLYATTSPALLDGSDFTIWMVFYDSAATNPSTFGQYSMYGTGGAAVRYQNDIAAVGHRIYAQGVWTSGGSNYVLEASPSTGAKFTQIRYDSSAGDGFASLNTMTETTVGTTGVTGGEWITGTYGVIPAIGANVENINTPGTPRNFGNIHVAEWVVIYGTPSTEEKEQFKAYVNSKYGTIIS
jgi:hypothetical protein